MSANVELDRVSIRFGDFTAVKNANLNIEGGEFFSFLGPSGCGKTTLLRAISGFNDPTEGEIRIDGQNMQGIGPNQRPTALIFQSLALFPLMSVADNISFGLKIRGVGKADRRRRADELLETIALPGQGDKLPSELSGGQRQRVAIARALAVEPKVLLLDEPLSALDLKLREHMRTELREIQQRVGITFIYITHDQGEALTMSDRIAVMSNGVIQQVGAAEDVYDSPETPFVASFVGANNPFSGRVTERQGDYAVIESRFGVMKGRNVSGLSTGDQATLFVRPQSLSLSQNPGSGGLVKSTVLNEEFEGEFVHLYMQGDERDLTMSLVNNGGVPKLRRNDPVSLTFDADRAVVLAQGELAHE